MYIKPARRASGYRPPPAGSALLPAHRAAGLRRRPAKASLAAGGGWALAWEGTRMGEAAAFHLLDLGLVR
jgi:hypothetical protein